MLWRCIVYTHGVCWIAYLPIRVSVICMFENNRGIGLGFGKSIC